MAQKERKARYTIANIVTADLELVHLSDEVRKTGVTHEDIYRIGLEALKNNPELV